MTEEIIPRLVTQQFERATRVSPLVLLEGPRASGKSTVLNMLRQAAVISSVVDFTDPSTRSAAASDPRGFVEGLTPPLAIDEVQLVPDLVLAIKQIVDEQPGWGPAILTGSSPVARGGLGGSDPLVGRAVRLRLRPLSHREMEGNTDTVIDKIADPAFHAFDRGVTDRPGYLELAKRSGFPAARHLAADDAALWFQSAYVQGVLPRALDDENRRVNPQMLGQLLRSLAAAPGTELNVSSLARRLDMNRHTVTNHVGLLGDLGLIDSVPGWRRGASKRHVSRHKLHPTDGAASSSAMSSTPTDAELGGLIESMVYRELAAQADNSFGSYQVFHWRTSNREVDLLLVAGDRFVPIEVKLSRSLPGNAVRGIDAFADEFPSSFARGIVFYAGDEVIPLGRDRLAVPISALWTTPADVAT